MCCFGCDWLIVGGVCWVGVGAGFGYVYDFCSCLLWCLVVCFRSLFGWCCLVCGVFGLLGGFGGFCGFGGLFGLLVVVVVGMFGCADLVLRSAAVVSFWVGSELCSLGNLSFGTVCCACCLLLAGK